MTGDNRNAHVSCQTPLLVLVSFPAIRYSLWISFSRMFPSTNSKVGLEVFVKQKIQRVKVESWENPNVEISSMICFVLLLFWLVYLFFFLTLLLTFGMRRVFMSKIYLTLLKLQMTLYYTHQMCGSGREWSDPLTYLIHFDLFPYNTILVIHSRLDPYC